MESDDFKIPSLEARKTIEISQKVSEWSTTHSSTFVRFAVTFICMLTSCLNSKQSMLIVSQESIWQRFHALRTSEDFTKKWDEFFASSVSERSFPSFTQYVSRKILHRIIEISYDIDCLEHVEFQHISSLECEALRYVAGYVCRKIQDQVKASSDGKKEAILLCLSELQKEMSVDDINNDEGHWIDRIDRGGLWHVNENTFTLFFIIEVEIRHHFTERVPENNDEKKEKILHSLYMDEDLQHHWAQMLSTIHHENIRLMLLQRIIHLYVTIRGFAFTNSCLELYKQRHSTSIQKSKALRRVLIND